MTDQELEELELKIISEEVTKELSHLKNPYLSELSTFIHTSLFSHKRCNAIQLPAQTFSDASKSSDIAIRQFNKYCNKYVPIFKLMTGFDEKKDDVIFVIDCDMFPYLKEHEQNTIVHVLSEFIEKIYTIRQVVRIKFRQLWKEERKKRKIESSK